MGGEQVAKVIVVFEVTPTAEGMERYLELAAKLKPLVADSGGFLGGDRFQSLSEPGKLLSVNLWENEEAAKKWRNQTEHRMAQMEGREKLFSSYKITVGHVVREYTDTRRTEAPADSNEHFGIG
jgi:heme-degrading monooxygenase HmoA